MARRKETLSQNDFGFGETRPEAVERDDTPLVVEGLKCARNTVGLTTGAIEGRPGTLHIGSTTALHGREVDLGKGRVFDVHVVADGVVVYGSDGSVDSEFLFNNWDALTSKYGSDTFEESQFWILPDPDTSSILIGSSAYPTHALVLDDAGAWAFGLFQYERSLNGAVQHPYFPYFPGVTITPSARTGEITVTASAPIWTDAYEGLRIRYVDREIILGTRVSSTIMNATVTEELPPTFEFTVASGAGYQVGDAVEHETLGGQGIVVSVSGNSISVLALVLWDGFAASEKLVGPNASQVISAQTSVSPGGSTQWDIQMGSRVHGYPGWGAKHKGRAYFNRYPSAPNAFAVSIAGRIDDFRAGPDDGDAFVETLGANRGGDLLYIISAEDLLFFTTRGLYYQPTRGGEDVTPKTIAPVPFSQMGCSNTVPVAIDDGAVFVDSVGEQIYAAMLAGDYYRSWTAKNISQYHSHLISSPVFLGATVAGSERPEHFIYAINDDGTVAVCQWDRDQNKIGWRPWETAGAFKSIYQAFGRMWSVVDREIGGTTNRFRERFEQGVYLDCASLVQIEEGSGVSSTVTNVFGSDTKFPAHLFGEQPAIFMENWDLGDATISSDGVPVTSDAMDFEFPDFDGYAQLGLPFTITVTPWPRRSVNTQRGARDIKRMVKAFITVLDTLKFKFEGYTFGGYRAGDDLTVPPKLRSEEFAAITGGRSAFEERPIVSDRPGPFKIAKLKYRVTV